MIEESRKCSLVLPVKIYRQLYNLKNKAVIDLSKVCQYELILFSIFFNFALKPLTLFIDNKI